MIRRAVFLVAGILCAQSTPEDTFIGVRGRYWAFQKVQPPALIRSPAKMGRY